MERHCKLLRHEYFCAYGCANNAGHTYCRHYVREYGYDADGNRVKLYSYPTIFITPEERGMCNALTNQWAEDHGMNCNNAYYHR